MLRTGKIIVGLLMLTFLFRLVVLYAPGIIALSTGTYGAPSGSALILEDGLDHYSTAPGPDLNIPMVKDTEENLNEELLKGTKYPLPLLIFLLSLNLVEAVGPILAWLKLSLCRRPSQRLYLAVSILRI